MSQSLRSLPLNIWIQSDLGALAMLARGPLAIVWPDPVRPPPAPPPPVAHAAAAVMTSDRGEAANRPRSEEAMRHGMSHARSCWR